jgi:hypothetical protein
LPCRRRRHQQGKQELIPHVMQITSIEHWKARSRPPTLPGRRK